jgi:triacylglycerol lipase
VKVFKILLAIALSMPAWSVLADDEDVADQHSDCVVLLHGLSRTELSMKPMQWHLADAGFLVSSPTYPSLSYPIEELAVMAVEEGLGECRAQGSGRIHFVTHSLGGILVRQYLSRSSIAELERVVMLGPPNQGSQVADYVSSLDILEPFTPDALEQLGTGEQSIPLRLGSVNFELGIIAGTSSAGVMPGSPESASDGTVAVAETVVPGMLDFLEMPVGHTFMMWSEAVQQQVVYFLRFGKFDRVALDAPAS